MKETQSRFEQFVIYILIIANKNFATIIITIIIAFYKTMKEPDITRLIGMSLDFIMIKNDQTFC